MPIEKERRREETEPRGTEVVLAHAQQRIVPSKLSFFFGEVSKLFLLSLETPTRRKPTTAGCRRVGISLN
jgi:hypothetical protein